MKKASRPVGYYIYDIPTDREVVGKLFDILQMNQENGSISGYLESSDKGFLFDDKTGDDPYWNWDYPPTDDLTHISCTAFLCRYDDIVEGIYKQFG